MSLNLEGLLLFPNYPRKSTMTLRGNAHWHRGKKDFFIHFCRDLQLGTLILRNMGRPRGSLASDNEGFERPVTETTRVAHLLLKISFEQILLKLAPS